MLSPNKKQMINVNIDTLQSPTKSSSMKYVSPKIVNNEPVAVRKVSTLIYSYHYHYYYIIISLSIIYRLLVR
jgi:hypothetical protein